jgi:hypothetical protein
VVISLDEGKRSLQIADDNKMNWQSLTAATFQAFAAGRQIVAALHA